MRKFQTSTKKLNTFFNNLESINFDNQTFVFSFKQDDESSNNFYVFTHSLDKRTQIMFEICERSLLIEITQNKSTNEKSFVYRYLLSRMNRIDLELIIETLSEIFQDLSFDDEFESIYDFE